MSKGRGQLLARLAELQIQEETKSEESGSLPEHAVSVTNIPNASSENEANLGARARAGPSRGRGRAQLLTSALKSLMENTEPPKKDVPKEEEIQIDEPPAHYHGERGQSTNVVSNYIKLDVEPNKGVYMYEVQFAPFVTLRSLRYVLLKQLKELTGDVKTFDGVLLYLPIKLKDTVTESTVVDTKTNEEYKIKIIFKRKQLMKDSAQMYNILIDRIMKMLKYVRHSKKQFDPSKPHLIPQHKLEIWPGYVTAIDEYEGGLMLCLDVSFRVLNTRTVQDVLRECIRGSREDSFKDNFEKSVLGCIVITRYNNKTYRVDEVLWDMSPMSTFELSDGTEISFADYYKHQYNIDVIDRKQPLLLHLEERRTTDPGQPVKTLQMCLIPELCNLTGLSDAQRSDFKVMKDVATYTRITPNQRVHSLRTFLQSVNECPQAMALLEGWGIHLQKDVMKLTARTMAEEQVMFHKKTFGVGPQADFNRQCTANEVIEAVDLLDWLLISTKRDQQTASKLANLVTTCGNPMGIKVRKPQIVELSSDSVDAYVQALRKNIRDNHQIVVTLCPTARDDRYAAIKRICCVEIPIPSQVINSRTLANDQKARGIVQKILLQMNCKMRGSLWKIHIPLKNVMIVGIDTYHDKGVSISSAVVGIVASLNSDYTHWFNRAIFQKKNEEVVSGMNQILEKAVETYEKRNGAKPTQIIVFRDGVSDGQLDAVKKYEIPQIKAYMLAKNYQPVITYLVVQKRINTRIMLENGPNYDNPPPGTVLDHTVSRRSLHDFFIVPQSVRQGSVTPTHFIVLEDMAKMPVDIVQKLCYKLCFLYYNWPGSIRVPACCQYAHKLAALVGMYLKRIPAEELGDSLFFL